MHVVLLSNFEKQIHFISHPNFLILLGVRFGPKGLRLGKRLMRRQGSCIEQETCVVNVRHRCETGRNRAGETLRVVNEMRQPSVGQRDSHQSGNGESRCGVPIRVEGGHVYVRLYRCREDLCA